ncbi:hypothetical protein Asulf_00089 [Archaeoglobus sulfaticallidus PM70-1]|uniref:Uncharacterized protein n=1 Tax=Archaeoglobus sulfaticallidus PM70-1 TaxID=387631 RepID=N0BIZ5_9EURY|nr:hypothetical protein [Archaeoglobus sulfaticallidus]AGK60125.1 hypothetical protein Asulf_00089 [Archaeoglobus sulfaticallidus PM70-1]
MRFLPVLLLFLAAFLPGCSSVEHKATENKTEVSKVSEKVKQTVNETEILKTAGVENASVTMLTPQNLTKLAKKYPAIYGNLPNKTLYQIKTENLLIIVDAEEKKVLRKFKLVGIKLGE